MSIRCLLLAGLLPLSACALEEDLVAGGGVIETTIPVDEDSNGDGGFSYLDGLASADLVDAVADEPCDPELVGEDEGPVEAIYAVVDGELAGLCFGDPSEVLVEAWLGMAAVTPPEELEPVVLLGGFASDGDTQAFTAAADDDRYEQFLVAVNLVAAEDSPDDMRLTMVHELSHVFTQTPDQLDVTADPDECDVYWNGAGCYYDDSYLARWVDEFWTEDDLYEQPGDGSADSELGLDRCELDPAFLGPYAASSPEEDLAESFSAFVFDLAVPPSVEPKLSWFETFPEFVAFRDLQRVSGLPDVPNNFEPCG